jgi:uncharacterized RDD family membrane protein YckC
LFARILDLLISAALFLLILIAVAIVMEIAAPGSLDAVMRFLDGPGGWAFGVIFVFVLSIPIALSLSVLGTTPGKWLFGVRIVDETGSPPAFITALKREMSVLVFGLAFLTIIAVITGIKSYRRLKYRGQTRWDESFQTQVYHRPNGSVQIIASILGVAIVLGLAFMMIGILAAAA